MVTRRNIILLRGLTRLDYRYIYILGNTRYLFRYKIGIAKSVENRRKGIKSTLNGYTYEIFAARFFFAESIEQTLHDIYRPLNARMKGSGKTEWFWMVLPISPTLVLSALWVIQWIFIPIFISALAYIFVNRDILIEILRDGLP
ncbi:MAG: GIY-YIG nuclease family protein [Saprospiraceae bacterium]|nr:GIY-YIG nuclease family protein [Saprospiraceae bacterium]